MKKIYFIDAYALIFRSYYAFISRPMRNKQGLNTSAIFGFTKFLYEIIKKEGAEYLGVAFDPKGGSFRKDIFPEYKANRKETPEDIIASVPYIKAILEAMRIPILEVPGFEADDVIGTLSVKAKDAGFQVYMVTPDKDYGQLVNENVYMYKQKKAGETQAEIVGLEQIKEHYGLDDPKLIIDILALWGDSADNIPGVMGIGEKGAIKLVNNFGTIENLLENTDKLSGKQKQNVIDGAEQLRLSKTLATISLDVPVGFVGDDYALSEPDADKLLGLYDELDFAIFKREVSSVKSEPEPVKVAPSTAPDLFNSAPEQVDLFSQSTVATAENTPHNYMLVEGEKAVQDLVEKLSQSKVVCFDTETTGLDTFNDKIVGISFSVKEFEAYYVPYRSEYREILRPLFENENIIKVGQNIKFDIMVLLSEGIGVHGFKIDTMILHYLLDASARHNMNHLARVYLDYSPIEIETLIGRGAKQLTMDLVATDKIKEYAAEDADVTYRLYKVLWPKVIDEGFETLYRTIEEPLIDVLAEIERNGVRVDTTILKNYGKELTQVLIDLETKIREIAGNPSLNINSAKQLGDMLFLTLKIEDKPKRTKTKQFRTDEEYLQQLSDRHPVIEMILEYRGLKKLLSTYIDALPELVNPSTGRIHTSYNQAVTATGRLSSTNPNLQNIPIRTEQGRHIREAFVPWDENHVLLSVDYSQVELRIMAHLSEDEALIEAFRNGEDIHSATAAKIFNVLISEVTAEQRRRAKTANFGIIYGISVFGLAQRLNISRPEAKEIIDGYFASYQGVKSYMDRVIMEAKNTGYVETIFKRKRYLADINSSNSIVRGLDERNAINAPIQGSAADIMKLAMIGVSRALKAENLESKIILQVHDELVLDVLSSELDRVKALVVKQMQDAASLSVELLAEAGVGENWVEAH
ncbi:MAG: DNA polymerase I [Rikenellaceae bacterium]